jgi:hypothetical protein
MESRPFVTPIVSAGTNAKITSCEAIKIADSFWCDFSVEPNDDAANG